MKRLPYYGSRHKPQDDGFLTAAQLRMLAVILDRKQKGLPCDRRSISKALGGTSPMLSTPFAALAKRGLISWEPGTSATLRPRCRMFLFEEMFQ